LSDVQLSKRLSLWLRHKPEAAALELDEAGWTDVDAVLTALASSGLASGRQRLEQVIAGNDKQRFELSPDGTRIRARQGHSVPVRLDWPSRDPPQHLYHGTVDRFLPAILAEGLKPMRRHHVHLSPDLETARKVGGRRGTPVILRVKAKALAAIGQPFFLTDNNVWLTAHVSASHLEAIAPD
jgi:putative RNA 2'-phosphotransferase